MRNQNSFIKVPNGITGQLKRNHCALYLRLLFICTVQKSNRIHIKEGTLAKALNVKFRETVSRELAFLEKKGYIKINSNYSAFGVQKCNTITVLHFNPKKDYFLIPVKHIQLALPGIATELMAYLYRYAYNHAYAMPSISTIRSDTGMSGSTISKAAEILEKNGVVIKKNYVRQDGSFGNNRYFLLFKIQKITGQERAIRLLIWLKKLSALFSASWRCVKEILRGDYCLLDNIVLTKLPQREENIPDTPKTKKRPFAFLEKIFSLAGKIRSFFSGIGHSIKSHLIY